MVNPDVDGYVKTLNHRKILWKSQKEQPTEYQKNIKPKYKLSGGPVFAFSYQRGDSSLGAPVS